MTGRELIIYILQNKLEDEPIVKDGMFIGFITEEEAAVKFNVGIATVRAGFLCGLLKGLSIGGSIYILDNTENPFDRNKNGGNNV